MVQKMVGFPRKVYLSPVFKSCGMGLPLRQTNETATAKNAVGESAVGLDLHLGCGGRPLRLSVFLSVFKWAGAAGDEGEPIRWGSRRLVRSLAGGFLLCQFAEPRHRFLRVLTGCSAVRLDLHLGCGGRFLR
jgi:hypothetical protein